MPRADSRAHTIGTHRGRVVYRWFGWVERRSNWQFVAVSAGIMLCVLVAMDCVMVLVTGRITLGSFIFYDVVFTALFTAFQAWKRWR
jgi:hypothetical protein